jgi:hypothetical protein
VSSLIERDASQGRTVALFMTQEPNVIFAYTDQQAVEDGVLVPVSGPSGVNRVTRAVFDYFTRAIGTSPITGAVTDISSLMEAIRMMVALAPDGGGWRTGAYLGKKLWLVPNEIGGLTLMFPEDY